MKTMMVLFIGGEPPLFVPGEERGKPASAREGECVPRDGSTDTASAGTKSEPEVA